jgi:hypothetical protein
LASSPPRSARNASQRPSALHDGCHSLNRALGEGGATCRPSSRATGPTAACRLPIGRRDAVGEPAAIGRQCRLRRLRPTAPDRRGRTRLPVLGDRGRRQERPARWCDNHADVPLPHAQSEGIGRDSQARWRITISCRACPVAFGEGLRSGGDSTFGANCMLATCPATARPKIPALGVGTCQRGQFLANGRGFDAFGGNRHIQD